MRSAFQDDTGPITIFLIVAVALVAALIVRGNLSFDLILFSLLQYFATIGPVALGLGLTMIAREFDLSVGSTMGFAGCVAVLTGGDNALIGASCGIGAGLAIGLFQGLAITGLGLSSIAVSLGGLMTVAGLSYVVTHNETISFANQAVTMQMNAPFLAIFSVRSLLAIACFVVAAIIFVRTRIGANLIATGSDRTAAMTSGVKTGRMVVCVFMLSGALAALSGVLLTFGLSVASPAGLTDILVPAISAAIIGGVSLSGGRGSPVGIAFGTLTLCALSAGLNALGLSPVVQQMVMAGVLFAVAIAAAPRLDRFHRWELCRVRLVYLQKTDESI
jgi:ribose transport system permease protein